MAADAEILRRIADGLPVGVWVARAPSGELVYANPMFAEILGMTARDDVAVGEYAQPYGIHDRTGALYPEGGMPFVRALQARDTVVVDDIVIHRTDGRKVNIRAQASPIFDEHGEISMIAIAFIDITREVTEEVRRRDTEARLARAQRMESIGQLAGGVAHDFNNLLAAIQMIVSSMRRGELTAKQQEDLRRIDEATQSAILLTRSLLGFSGRAPGHPTSLSLDAVIESVVPLLRRTFDRRIEIVVDAQATRHLVGDRAQLEQVIMNLAMNARDAMPEGGELRIHTRDDGDRVVLEVSDTGSGIPADLRDRIFEPYFTTKTTGPVRGTGLGLATVYGIVVAMGGSVAPLDRDPRGTIMRIELPGVAGAGDVQEASEPAAAPSIRRSGHETLLLVDDDEAVRTITAEALSAIGYRIIEARDGVEGVAVFQQRHGEIDAVVLDLMMPRMSGDDAYREMARIEPGVRVLVTTGFAGDLDVDSIIRLGVRGVLAKPYDLDRLSDAIAAVLG